MSFLPPTLARLRYYKHLGDLTFKQISDADFHFMPDNVSNSIAVIIQHMHGNMMSRWTNFLTEDGEKEWRQRDAEFQVHDFSREQLLQLWEEGWTCFFNAIEPLQPGDFERTITIRGESLTVIDAILRQLAHYPYHVGQIVYIGRMIRKEKWESLSIPVGESQHYNSGDGVKDPAKKFRS